MEQSYEFPQADDIKWKFNYRGLTGLMQVVYDILSEIEWLYGLEEGSLIRVDYRRYWLASFVSASFDRSKISLNLDDEHELDMLLETILMTFEDTLNSDTIPDNIDVSDHYTLTDDIFLYTIEFRPERISPEVSP